MPFFGAVTGVIVNYSPDRAVRFDLAGTPIECLPRAYCPRADLVHAARQEGAVVFHDLLRGCLPFLDTYRTMPGPRASLAAHVRRYSGAAYSCLTGRRSSSHGVVGLAARS